MFHGAFILLSHPVSSTTTLRTKDDRYHNVRQGRQSTTLPVLPMNTTFSLSTNTHILHTHARPILPTNLLCWEKGGLLYQESSSSVCLLEMTGALPAQSLNKVDRTDGCQNETGIRRRKMHMYSIYHLKLNTLSYNECLRGSGPSDLLKWSVSNNNINIFDCTKYHALRKLRGNMHITKFCFLCKSYLWFFPLLMPLMLDISILFCIMHWYYIFHMLFHAIAQCFFD